MSWVRVVAGIVGLLLLVRLLSHADLSQVLERIETVGVLGCVVLLPAPISLALESWGWRRAFGILRVSIGFFPLYRVRLSTEALLQSLPGGAALCESVKPMLLARHGVDLSQSLASMAARRYLLLCSQGVFFLIVVGLGFDQLQAISRALTGSAGLGLVALFVGLSLLLAALLVRLILTRSRLIGRALAWVGRLGSARIRAWSERLEPRARDTDRYLRRFFGATLPERARAGAPMLLGWLCESVETYIIVRLLQCDLDFVTVASVEILMSFTRHLLFMLPAGLGVQDVGYGLFFKALGVPDPIGLTAAFVLLKRGKELAWISVGYLVLAGELRRPRAAQLAVRANPV